MIARARRRHSYAERFLQILPQMQTQARFAFHHEPTSHRQDLVAETIANCWLAFVRLMDRGLESLIYPTPLVQLAIKKVRDGRQVGNKLNVNDISFPYCQQAKDITVESLDAFGHVSALRRRPDSQRLALRPTATRGSLPKDRREPPPE